MKLEHQVCSPEPARRLEELGVKQESHFYWYGGQVLRANQLTQELRRHSPPVSAFTVAELGEMLPAYLDGAKWKLVCAKFATSGSRFRSDAQWYCSYENKLETKYLHQYADTEADARAKMLIYLLENNLIDKEV